MATASDADVPEIGDMVRYRGCCYTVTGWLRTASQEDSDDGDPGGDAPRPLLFATYANATHVRIRDAGTGITAARLADIEPTSNCALFAPNTIRAAHRIAGYMDGQPTDYYDPEPECVEELP